MRGKGLWYALALLVIWQMGAMLAGNALLMPSVWAVIKDLADEIVTGHLLIYSLYSLLAIAAGLGLSMLLALGIAMVSIRYRGIMAAFKWLGSVMHPLPGIAILPLLIIWFGVGYGAILFLILHSVIWPILINLFSAIETFPPTLVKVGDNYEMNTIRKFFFLYLPGIMPAFIAGLKTGWARAFRAVISAEMFFGAIGSTGGLGWFLVRKRVFLDTTGLFAGLLVIMIIGVLFESILLKWLERKTIARWGVRG